MGGCCGDHGVGRAVGGRPRLDGSAGGRADRTARRGHRDPLHAARPRRGAGRRGAQRAGPPARRLPAPPAAPAGRAAARGRRRVDRRRQVDPGEHPGPGRRSARPGCCGRPPARRCWSAIPTTVHWFSDDRVLPELARTSRRRLRPADAAAGPARRRSTPGWRSWTRRTSTRSWPTTAGWPRQLLAAADLWLFVTTAARYADAVPWDAAARRPAPRHRARGGAQPGATGRPGDIGPPAADAAEHGLGAGAAVRRARGDPGRRPAPEPVVAPLRTGSRQLAADAAHGPRSSDRPWTARCAAWPPRVPRSPAADGPVDRGAALRERADVLTRRAGHGRRGRPRRHRAARRGAGPLAGVRRHRRADAHPAVPGRALRDRVTAALTGRPPAGQELTDALESSVVSLVDGRRRPGRRGPRRPGGAAPAGAALLGAPRTRAGPPARGFAGRPRTEVGPGRARCSTWCRSEGAPAPDRRPAGVFGSTRTGLARHARRLRPDRRSRPGPRSRSPAGRSGVRRRCWRRSSATRPSGRWPTRPGPT